jgi:hypothetical protein
MVLTYFEYPDICQDSHAEKQIVSIVCFGNISRKLVDINDVEQRLANYGPQRC